MNRRINGKSASETLRGEFPNKRIPRTCSPAEIAFIRETFRRNPAAQIVKRGWPDFCVVYPGNEIELVEIKRKPRAHLKPTQRVIAELLRSQGIRVTLWTPKT